MVTALAGQKKMRHWWANQCIRTGPTTSRSSNRVGSLQHVTKSRVSSSKLGHRTRVMKTNEDLYDVLFHLRNNHRGT